MKIVLRHKTTGRYYRSPGRWVRRADNALSFDALESAQQYQRQHHINETQPVLRLAPYLMPLLHGARAAEWERWLQSRASGSFGNQTERLGDN
jgi:hypothetical protein